MNENPFVIVKFLPTNNDKDEYYEIALSKWVQDLDENMNGIILWPKDNSVVGTLVRTEASAQSNWFTYTVQVIRYYKTYFHARKGLTGIIKYASAYETDTGKEMGKGRRKKIKKKFTSSESLSDESDNDQRKKKQFKKKISISSPPAIHVSKASFSADKNSRYKSKKYIIEDSPNLKKPTVARHLKKSTLSENREKLIERITNARKKTVKKAEEKNNARSLTAPSKVLSPLHNQSKPSTSFKRYVESPSIITKLSISRSERYVKSPSLIMKPSKKTLSDNREMHNNTKTNTKEVKKSENSPVSSDSLSYISDNQFTSLSSKKETFSCVPSSVMSFSEVSNIFKKSDNLPKSGQNSPLSNLESEKVQCNEMDSLSQSSEKVDTLILSTQEEHTPLSFKKRSKLPIHNLLNSFNGSDFNKCFIKLEKKLEDVSSKLDVVIMNQANLNKSLFPEQAIINRPAGLPSLPLSDMKSLEEFEKFISKDVNLSATCYYLKSLALGNNEKTATSKLMTHLMTNSLATHFNFDGYNSQKATKVKKPFKELQLWELFQGVMLLKFPNSDLTEALHAVRSWLRNATGRKQD